LGKAISVCDEYGDLNFPCCASNLAGQKQANCSERNGATASVLAMVQPEPNILIEQVSVNELTFESGGGLDDYYGWRE